MRDADFGIATTPGACNEWLKKIAEPNPDFLVVTFTDESCTSLFIKPVNED